MIIAFIILIPVAIVAFIIKAAGGINAFLPISCSDTAEYCQEEQKDSIDTDTDADSRTYDYTTICSPSGFE